MQELKDKYLAAPYEPLVPEKGNPKQFVYKFNSITHFLSWVEGLHKNDDKWGSNKDSDARGNLEWYKSKSLENAYDVIREVNFESSGTGRLEAMIRRVRKSSKYAEEGYEIEVGEFVAGSDRHWINESSRRSVSRLIDDYLFLDICVMANKEAEAVRKTGMAVLDSIYRRNIVPRKLVICIFNERVTSNGDKSWVFVDVNFKDLNGIAKLLHPSTFRRIYFRLIEVYPDLAWGYGRVMPYSLQKGYLSIDKIVRSSGFDKPEFQDYIETFLGIKK